MQPEPDRNIIVTAAHVHCGRYILSLVARQVYLEKFNAAWTDVRYIKHIMVLPLGVIEESAGGTCTGYGRVNQNGFEEVVLRRIGKRQSSRSFHTPGNLIPELALEPAK